jgi:hypothetical protein
MKKLFDRNTKYSITLKMSIILSQLVFICLFYFFPKINSTSKLKIDDPIILIEDIPITIQQKEPLQQKPAAPQIVIEDLIEEPEMLADIIPDDESKNEPSAEISHSVLRASLSNNLTAPRQILEVLPENDKKNISGSIKLSLKINESGKVIDHKIMFNDLKCEDCLSEILAAAYKSKWESGFKSEIDEEFWVEKTYSFY